MMTPLTVPEDLTTYLTPEATETTCSPSEPVPKEPVVLRKILNELDSCTREHGPEHSKVADAWNALGLIRLHMQNNAVAAIKCHQQALRIYRLNESELSVQVATALNDLGSCYERVNERGHALEVYEVALTSLSAAEVSDVCQVKATSKRAVARLQRS